ncbi:MAG: Ig-like domain-containing protein [Prevotellaceae bacterium]|jgi:hypothetical protein|nr:Ig-like domain-containing protein [Prevotellaceae bacterium]
MFDYFRKITNGNTVAWAILGLMVSAQILLSMFLSGCANSSVAPTGGLKDTLAPVLVKMNPPQKTTNFNGKELSFTFNEYVQIKDQKKFVISPPLPSKKPELKIKGKSVVVRFPSLADSVTYYLDFGTSVVDVNESNPAKYLNFIFSTGDVLDTMLFVGRIVDSYTLEPVAEANVFFYELDNDSIVFKKNPSALSICNKEGVFIVKGLKNIRYKMVAVADKNTNMRYDAGVESIAFPDSLIQPILLSENDSIEFKTLPAFTMFTENKKRQGLTENKRPEERLIMLCFNEINATVKSFDIEGINSEQVIEEKNITGDTVRYWLKGREIADTVRAKLVYLKTDSLNNLSPDTVRLRLLYSKPKRKQKDKDKETEEEEIIPIEPAIIANPATIVERDIVLAFKTPLLRADTSKISIQKSVTQKDKTIDKIPVKFSLIHDSISLRHYRVSAAWEVASKYEITIMPEAFVDIYSITNDTITKVFETADPEKFGELTLELHNNHANKQYIAQLIKDKRIVQERPLTTKTVFRYLAAGEYSMRMIEDANANGKWDTGNYLEKRQAERVVFLFSGVNDALEVKTNWEHVQTIDANTLFDNVFGD